MSENRICPLTQQECQFDCVDKCMADKDKDEVASAVFKTLERTSAVASRKLPKELQDKYQRFIEGLVVKKLNR